MGPLNYSVEGRESLTDTEESEQRRNGKETGTNKQTDKNRRSSLLLTSLDLKPFTSLCVCVGGGERFEKRSNEKIILKLSTL